MNWYLKALKNYAAFSGRSQRKEYWYFYLFAMFIFPIVLGLIDIAIGTFDSASGVGLLLGIYSLAMIIPSIAVSVRRLHDIGRSGWWFLIVFVPLIGVIVLLVLHALDSQPGKNKYGENPKETTS